MNRIIESIQAENWDSALKLFLEYSESNPLDTDAYIVGATIMEHYENRETMFSFITEGLRSDPCNHELYMLLGNYYRGINADLAYLSYENALYHSIRGKGCDEDTALIKAVLEEYSKNHTITVNNVSFVILSYNELDLTRECISSIREYCYDKCYEIIVVDNASTDGSVEWLREQKDIVLIENKTNAGFPAGCNRGIRTAKASNDIFLLNNDTRLLPNSLYSLRMGLYQNDSIGAAGAVTNHASRDQVIETDCRSDDDFVKFASVNNIPSSNSYEHRMYLIMFAMLIKRKCLDDTGLLDERFTPGNFEDNDYGIRLNQNGYKCVLCHNCFIYHAGSASFGKDARRYNSLFVTNKNKFREKWGFAYDHYSTVRSDLIDMISSDRNDPISVFEVGCGFGETLSRIKYRFPNAVVSGIEAVEQIAGIANKRMDIIYGDIESFELDGSYDYIVMADVLECLNDPGPVLLKMKKHLNRGGCILVSVRNAMNAGDIYELLTDSLTYNEADRSPIPQLHRFTLGSIRQLIDNSGYMISDVYTTFLPDKTTDAHDTFFDALLNIDGVACREEFDAYQFLMRISVK